MIANNTAVFMKVTKMYTIAKYKHKHGQSTNTKPKLLLPQNRSQKVVRTDNKIKVEI